MPKLTKTAMRYRRTDPNYRKALLLKREGYNIHISLVKSKFCSNAKTPNLWKTLEKGTITTFLETADTGKRFLKNKEYHVRLYEAYLLV